jgi:ureidoacrylate peracid hydrolase
MHRVEIPRSVTERVVQRRGRRHVFDALEPARTALLVVDLQKGFMVEGVGHAYVPGAVDIVPNVNRLAAAVRGAGGKVYWIKNTHDAECLTGWSVMHNEMTTPDRQAARVASMSRGTVGHELHDDLDVRADDPVVEKTRFSALIPGSSDLDARLRAAGIDTVIVVGTVTNVCCESTARDAMMLNYKVVMVSDANAAQTDEEHNASLISVYLTFGDVMDTAETLAAVAAGERAVA